MKITKFTIFLFSYVFVASAYAGIEDCPVGSGTAYLKPIAQAIAMKNNPPPIFIKNLLNISNKNDSDSLEKLSNSLSCSIVSKDPTNNDSEGLAVIVFTKKDDAVKLSDRVNQPAIQLWAVGGANAMMNFKKFCFRIKYTLEKDREWKESFIMDRKPGLSPVQVCE
jgi:hypothetical protein